MGKKARNRSTVVQESSEGAVGPRQPCPCGSGRRYKACHGNPDGAPVTFAARPFADFAGETELIALREFVPSATAPLKLKDSDRQVVLATLLPGAAPALIGPDSRIWLGLQVQHGYGNPSRDLAAVLERALKGEPGDLIGLTSDPGDGPTLADLVEGGLEVTVHDGFDFWNEALDGDPDALATVLEQANAAIAPTARLATVTSAFWTSVGDREFLRWVRPEPEDAVLDALARLHQAGRDTLVPGGRLIGMFRAHGVLVPVWDLPVGTGAEALAEPAAAFEALLAEALGDSTPLTAEQRSARAGLASRQVTVR